MADLTINTLYVEADEDTMKNIRMNILTENDEVSYALLIPEDHDDPKYSIKAGHYLFNPDDAREDGTCFNWYDFRIEKWGCKWDVGEGDTISIDESEKDLYIIFYSPNEPPSEWFKTLCKTFPTASFKMMSENSGLGLYWSNGVSFNPFEYFDKNKKIVEAISEYINIQEYDIEKVIGVIEEEPDIGRWNIIDGENIGNSYFELLVIESELEELLEGCKKQS